MGKTALAQSLARRPAIDGPTGKLPDLSLEREQLFTLIEDETKRELVAFALREEPSERPRAEALLQKTVELEAVAMRSKVGMPSNAVRVGDGWAYTEQKD